MDEKSISSSPKLAADYVTTQADSSMNGESESISIIVENDPAAEAKLTRKLDIRLIPILGLTYLVLFLDRTNIANAKIQGMEKGLHMPSNGFNTCLWIFYLPFALSEIPSNYLMSLPGLNVNWFMSGQMFLLGEKAYRTMISSE